MLLDLLLHLFRDMDFEIYTSESATGPLRVFRRENMGRPFLRIFQDKTKMSKNNVKNLGAKIFSMTNLIFLHVYLGCVFLVLPVDR